MLLEAAEAERVFVVSFSDEYLPSDVHCQVLRGPWRQDMGFVKQLLSPLVLESILRPASFFVVVLAN